MTQDIPAIIARYLDDQATPEEVALLDDLMLRDPAVRRQFVEMAEIAGMLAEAMSTGAVRAHPSVESAAKDAKAANGAKGPRVDAAHSRAARSRTGRGASRWKRIAIPIGLMAACLVLAFVVSRPAPAPVGGRLVSWHGGVTILRAGGWRSPSQGMSLAVEDRIETAADGQADIAWDDWGAVAIAADSKATLRIVPAGPVVSLERGRVDARFAHAAARGRIFTVNAGDWRVTDVGTSFSVRMDGGRPRVAVSEGEVEIAVGAISVPVKAGQEAKQRSDGIPEVAWNAAPAIFHQEGETGKTTGTITSIDKGIVTLHSEQGDDHYMPDWVGGYGGGYDKKGLELESGFKVGDHVTISWVFKEHCRILSITKAE